MSFINLPDVFRSLNSAHRLWLLYVVIATGLSACVTSNQERVNQQAQERANQQTQEEALRQREERRETDFNQLRAGIDAFDKDATVFRNYPGWSDMADIIRGYDSLVALEGADQATRKTLRSIAQWSRKWDADGTAIYLRHNTLMQRARSLVDSLKALDQEAQAIISQRSRLLNLRQSQGFISPNAFLLQIPVDMKKGTRQLARVGSEITRLLTSVSTLQGIPLTLPPAAP